MNNTLIQSVMWIAAAGMLVLYLKRRRSRKTTN